LPKTGERGEGVPLTVTGMTTATGCSHKQRAEAGFFSKYIIIKGYISPEKLLLLLVRQPIYRAIQYFIICRGFRLQLFTSLKAADAYDYY
jgi:hypothetical protein